MANLYTLATKYSPVTDKTKVVLRTSGVDFHTFTVEGNPAEYDNISLKDVLDYYLFEELDITETKLEKALRESNDYSVGINQHQKVLDSLDTLIDIKIKLEYFIAYEFTVKNSNNLWFFNQV